MEKQIFEPLPAMLGRVSEQMISPEDIQQNALIVFGITKDELDSKSRKRPAPECRQAISFLIRKYSGLSHYKIRQYVGNRDRSTVIHSIETAQALIDTDKVFAAKVVQIEQRLEGSCA